MNFYLFGDHYLLAFINLNDSIFACIQRFSWLHVSNLIYFVKVTYMIQLILVYFSVFMIFYLNSHSFGSISVSSTSFYFIISSFHSSHVDSHFNWADSILVQFYVNLFFRLFHLLRPTISHNPNSCFIKSYFRNTLNLTQRRGAVRGKANFVVNFVPQQEAWVVERMGKFHSILDPVSICFNNYLAVTLSHFFCLAINLTNDFHRDSIFFYRFLIA